MVRLYQNVGGRLKLKGTWLQFSKAPINMLL